MNCYNIRYVYRGLIFQIYIKGNLVANEILVKYFGVIDALKGEGDASKRETILLFFRCQIVKATSGYYV